MILTIKYWIRYILALCLIAAIAYMIACSIVVTYLISKGYIKIQRISGNRKKAK